MTDKERLEEIRNRMIVEKHHFKYLNSEKGYWENVYTLLEQDVQYLFEQAERVQELERQRKEDSHDFVNRIINENKRYREALEFYAREKNYNTFYDLMRGHNVTMVLEDRGIRAINALEESK